MCAISTATNHGGQRLPRFKAFLLSPSVLALFRQLPFSFAESLSGGSVSMSPAVRVSMASDGLGIPLAWMSGLLCGHAVTHLSQPKSVFFPASVDIAAICAGVSHPPRCSMVK